MLVLLFHFGSNHSSTALLPVTCIQQLSTVCLSGRSRLAPPPVPYPPTFGTYANTLVSPGPLPAQPSRSRLVLLGGIEGAWPSCPKHHFQKSNIRNSLCRFVLCFDLPLGYGAQPWFSFVKHSMCSVTMFEVTRPDLSCIQIFKAHATRSVTKLAQIAQSDL